jgi:FHS family L-fucose permease-like MFS transporter
MMERTKSRRLTPYPLVTRPTDLSSTDKEDVHFVNRRQSSWFSSIKQRRQTESTTKNAAQLTLRESIVPLVLVISLFFIWGFAGGLGEVLNKQFQKVLGLSKLQSTGLQVAFYG